MTIELAITDETPPEEQQGLSDEDILDCFLGTPLNGSYRDYLLRSGRRILELAQRPSCGNCDTTIPPGCGGIFRDDGTACALNKAAA